MTTRGPNVLIIVTDQEQSWSTLPPLPLPAHERLRERGVSFDRFHVNTSPCGPSRSNLYTGHHTQRTGMHVNPDTPPRPALPTDLPSIGHVFRKAGYYTAYKGKWHLSDPNEGCNFFPIGGQPYKSAVDALEPYGFADYSFYGEVMGLAWDGYRHDGTTAGDACRWLHEVGEGTRAAGQPWLLAVNFVNPHDIMFFDATGRQNESRELKNHISVLVGAPGDVLYREDLGFDLPESFYKESPETKPEIQSFVRSRQSSFYGDVPVDDVESWRRLRNYYFNCLRDVDRHIATVLDGLDQAGLADETIVVLMSDHGERAGAHQLHQKAGTVYEEESGIPFVVVHPDVDGGVSTDALGSMVDVLPTIASLAGIERPVLDAPWPGVDLSPVVARPAERTARDQQGSLLNYTGMYHWQRKALAPGETGPAPFDLSYLRLYRGVIWERYKFARYFAPAHHHRPENWETLLAHNDLEVYDLEADPHEIDNLGHDPWVHREIIEMLNTKTNALIDGEVGDDTGECYPEGSGHYRLAEG